MLQSEWKNENQTVKKVKENKNFRQITELAMECGIKITATKKLLIYVQTTSFQQEYRLCVRLWKRFSKHFDRQETKENQI